MVACQFLKAAKIGSMRSWVPCLLHRHKTRTFAMVDVIWRCEAVAESERRFHLMTGCDREGEPGRAELGVFATTHWSVVLAAGHVQSAPSKAALEQLCRTYWQPLYLYVRRQGFD